MSDSDKVFRLLVDFVYKEVINEFINNNGECKNKNFTLINWSILFDKNNKDFYGNLETKFVYKCYVVHLISLLSKFFTKPDDSTLILEIAKVLNDGNLIFSIPFSFSITYELKVVCFKMISYLVQKYPKDDNINQLKRVLDAQDFIDDNTSCEKYTKKLFHIDICRIIKSDESLSEQSDLKYFLKSTKSDRTLTDKNFEPKHSMATANIFSLLVSDEDSNILPSINSPKINNENSDPCILADSRSDISCCSSSSSEKNTKFTYEYEDGLPVWRKCNNEKPEENRQSNLNLKFKSNHNSSTDSDDNSTNNKKRKFNKFSKEEYLYLVYFVEKYGRQWSLIASEKFRKYFNNRSGKDLCAKYDALKKKEKYFQKLKKESKYVSEKF